MIPLRTHWLVLGVLALATASRPAALAAHEPSAPASPQIDERDPSAVEARERSAVPEGSNSGRAFVAGDAAERKTQNVILVTLDGLRWQEVFDGA